MKKMREEWKGGEVIRRLAEKRRAPGGVFPAGGGTGRNPAGLDGRLQIYAGPDERDALARRIHAVLPEILKESEALGGKRVAL